MCRFLRGLLGRPHSHLAESPETTKGDREMTEEKKIRLGRQILTETDLEFTVEVRGEVFTLRYPTPAQRNMIEAEIARRLGGQPRSAFSPEYLTTMEAFVYVDYLLVTEKSPDWLKNVWECVDEELIGKLYTGYFQFRGQLQRKIREGEYTRAGT